MHACMLVWRAHNVMDYSQFHRKFAHRFKYISTHTWSHACSLGVGDTERLRCTNELFMNPRKMFACVRVHHKTTHTTYTHTHENARGSDFDGLRRCFLVSRARRSIRHQTTELMCCCCCLCFRYNSKLTLLALPSVIYEPRFRGSIRNLVYSDQPTGPPRRQEMRQPRDIKVRVGGGARKIAFAASMRIFDRNSQNMRMEST